VPVASLSSSRFELDTPAPVGGSAAERRRMGSGALGQHGKPTEGACREARAYREQGRVAPVSGRAVKPQYCSCRVAHVVDGVSSGSTTCYSRIEEPIEEQIKWASICVALLLARWFAPRAGHAIAALWSVSVYDFLRLKLMDLPWFYCGPSFIKSIC
jgi:hypothetical protein